jgi:hypothetical protein
MGCHFPVSATSAVLLFNLPPQVFLSTLFLWLGERHHTNGRLLRWENIPKILHNRQQYSNFGPQSTLRVLFYRSAFAQIFPRSQPMRESKTSTTCRDVLLSGVSTHHWSFHVCLCSFLVEFNISFFENIFLWAVRRSNILWRVRLTVCSVLLVIRKNGAG